MASLVPDNDFVIEATVKKGGVEFFMARWSSLTQLEAIDVQEMIAKTMFAAGRAEVGK